MPVIEHRIFIKAPIDLCFDLARNVNSINDIRNRKEDLLSEGNTVTRVTATKQKITMKVIFMERPNSFVEKIRGPFRSLIHIHQFVEEEGGTVMLDHVQYKARFGPVGAAVDKILLERLMKSFIISRSEKLKELAET
jgi:ligand-binding SRPBCC domain-containing protein